jgi:hypothetical protein
VDWSRWVDEAWKELFGLVYYLLGPQMIYIIFLNALLSGAGAVLVYWISTVAFDDDVVAHLAAYLWALFPSVVYYTALPLKEAAAVFALLSICWGIERLLAGNRRGNYQWIAMGLLIMVGLRLYLVPLLSACVVLSLLFARVRKQGGSFLHILFLSVAAGLFCILLVRSYGVDLTEYQAFEYYDVETVNEVRMRLTRGNARMFEHGSESLYGENWLDNTIKVLKGVFFFFFSLDVTSINRQRQLAALPEMAFFLYCVPYLISSIRHGFQHRAAKIFPLVIIALCIIAVYGSAATNAGAMYRWRVQALPFLIMLIVYGAAVRRRGLLYTFLRKTAARMGRLYAA